MKEKSKITETISDDKNRRDKTIVVVLQELTLQHDYKVCFQALP